MFSPDGTTLASGSGEVVQLWDASTWESKGILTGHTGTIRTIAFSPDGRTLASGSVDYTVRLWNVPTGRLKTILIGHTHTVESIAFSPDGTILASGNGYWDRTLRLWDVTTGQQYATLIRAGSSITSVAFSPDGTILADGGSDNTIRLWDPATGQRTGECFQIFIDELSATFPDSLNIIVLDNGRFHHAKSLVIADNVVLIFLPPYSPELNRLRDSGRTSNTNSLASHSHGA